MPTMIRTSERQSFQPHVPPRTFPGTAAVEQVATLREMLPTLETLTVPGRRHNMRKIVSRIEQLVDGVEGRLFVAALLGKLAGESSRLHPDVRTFNEAAEQLLDLFS
jgi:hypothetical protein